MIPENPEASLLGAAILGMAAVKKYSSISEAIGKMVHFNEFPESDCTEKEIADFLFRRYLEIANSLKLHVVSKK